MPNPENRITLIPQLRRYGLNNNENESYLFGNKSVKMTAPTFIETISLGYSKPNSSSVNAIKCTISVNNSHAFSSLRICDDMKTFPFVHLF